MESLSIGQRWINEAELSLGLGTLVGADERTLRIDFAAISETRTYARRSAALSRAVFEPGDRLKTREGLDFLVQEQSETDGLITYLGEDAQGSPVSVHEMRLSEFTQINRAHQRLLAGHIDNPQRYLLRQRARLLQDEIAHSPVRGLISGRTGLVPHQLYIADEVARRQLPRVLLADEVGLGKTIEAGLILNSRLIAGTTRRVLVIVPDHLLNQWLVEMLRRFNLHFSLFGPRRFESDTGDLPDMDFDGDGRAENHGVRCNPFDDEQLVLCSPELFHQVADAERCVLSSDWDMLIVDEAHHLAWDASQPSQDYLLVERLAALTPAVLLLTATPEQLGREGHFARLRLLDPARFHDYQAYVEEEQNYRDIADLVEALEAGSGSAEGPTHLDTGIGDRLRQLDIEFDHAADNPDTPSVTGREHLVEELLDRHGTGRLLFRNTRATISGFPERKLHRYALALPEDSEYRQRLVNPGTWRDALTPEMAWVSSHGSDAQPWTRVDSRVSWLFDLLKQLAPEKVLVIAAQAETAMDLAEAMRLTTGAQAAVFHEDMSIIERDRAAAFFADEEYGGQCLICSEIGSEGRNFQCVHHLILFDLPSNPDLLEQRIGRLDRIGQRDTINIHLPHVLGTAQMALTDFYHLGLDAFEHTSAVASAIVEDLGEALDEMMLSGEVSGEFIEEVAANRQDREQELRAGRDRLLERNSCRTHIAERLCEQASTADRAALSGFVEAFADVYGLEYETQTSGTAIIRPTDAMPASLRGLPDDGLTLTYDRDTALAQEDMEFLTWDHPLTASMLDAVLNSELGNTSLVTMRVKGIKPGSLMLESIFALEAPEHRQLQVGQYLPASRIRVVVDQSGRVIDNLSEELVERHMQPVKKSAARQVVQSRRAELKGLIRAAQQQADGSVTQMRAEALDAAEDQLGREIGRLRKLRRVNPAVRPEEIQVLERQQQKTLASLRQIETSLDALRMVIFV